MVRGTFSPARAWRPAVGPASPQKLGSTGTALQYASEVRAWRPDLNTRRGQAANTPVLLSRQIHSHAQAAVTLASLDGSFKNKGFCARSVCQLREKTLISVSSSGRLGRPWRGRRCHPGRRLNTWLATSLCAEREAAKARGQKLQGMAALLPALALHSAA